MNIDLHPIRGFAFTGTIKNIGSSAANPVSVSSPSITIKIDPEIQPKEYTPSDWKKLSGEELIGRIKQAGIVGIRGAGFPAHIKLAPLLRQISIL